MLEESVDSEDNPKEIEERLSNLQISSNMSSKAISTANLLLTVNEIERAWMTLM